MKLDTTLGLSSLLRALQRPREISTNYGLNDTIQDMKMGQPDVQDYEIALTEDGEVAPGPRWRHLFRWLVAQAHEILDFDSVYIITDNRDLVSSAVDSQPGLAHWPALAAWWSDRIKYLGP